MSLLLQDCVATADIRMSVLVNTGPGRGIASVRAEDMVCRWVQGYSDDDYLMMIRCDPASCQCFHAQYEDTGSYLDEVSSVHHPDASTSGRCDDRCILGMTLSLR